MRCPVILFSVCFLFLFSASGYGQDSLEDAIADPPATGLLVLSVVEESQAEWGGIHPGDILVAYDGKKVTTTEELARAKTEAEGQEYVAAEIVRRNERLTLPLTPGPIGIHVVSAKKGEALPGLPPETGVKFDFSRLEKGPLEQWFDFFLEGERQGFEHAVTTLSEGKIVIAREVGFRLGENLEHFVVTVTLTPGTRPTVDAVSFETPLTGWLATGMRQETEPSHHVWVVRSSPDEGTVTEGMTDWSDQLLPTYAIEALTPFLPQEEGATFRFVPIGDADGSRQLTSALTGKGWEEVEVEGEKQRGFRFDWVSVGGTPLSSHWVSDAGEVLRSDYGGGAVSIRTTKLQALSAVPEGITPKTVGETVIEDERPKDETPEKPAPDEPKRPDPPAQDEPGEAEGEMAMATGLLIASVLPGSAAEGIGLAEGDILVSYAGSPTVRIEDLQEAMSTAAAAEAVELRVVRGAEVLVYAIEPGTLGVTLVPVEEGRPMNLLPPDTEPRLDTSGRKGPFDYQYDFFLAGERRGSVRVRISSDGSKVFGRYEVEFDGGEEWGENHHRVTIVQGVGPIPLPLMTRYDDRANQVVATGVIDRTTGGREPAFVTVLKTDVGAPESWSETLRGPVVATYAIELVAAVMPREKGACLRFTPLYEGNGRLGLPSAILCAEAETISHRGVEVETWRYEWRQQDGSLAGTYWLDADGRMLKADYDGAVAILE